MKYTQLTNTLSRDRQSLHELLMTLPHMSIVHRKVVMTICRTQSSPVKGSTTYSRLFHDMRDYIDNPSTGGKTVLGDLIRNCTETTTSLYSGFVSMMLRNAPFPDDQEILEVIRSGVKKELTAAIEIYHPISLDWFSVLSSDKLYRIQNPLFPGAPINPAINHQVYYRLRSSKSLLSSAVFYPDYSRKTIGRNASYNLRMVARELGMNVENTTLGLEQIYHEYGFRIQGETEMRWAWKYNDLKPRMYYARGPDQYYASRYIQQVFNILVDCLPVTHKFDRFNSHIVRMSPDDTAFIYDYSSFTSKLHEVMGFLRALGEFLSDVNIQVIDTYYGARLVNLKDMFEDFIRECHSVPFDCSGLDKSPNREEEILHHNCGMLGVPGNISSCTLLHGIHLIIILQHLLCKVVGDDAFGFGVIESEGSLAGCLRNIGEISIPKMNFWHPENTRDPNNIDSRWEYVKRPIDRIDQRIVVDTQIIWPPVALLLGWSDKFHTTVTADNDYRKFKKIAGMLLSFSWQFQTLILEEEDLQFVNRFIRVVEKESGLAEYCRLNKELIYPRIIRCGRIIDGIVEDIWNSVVGLPDLWESGQPLDERTKGEWFVGKNHKMLKLMEDLGYAIKVKRIKRFVVRDNEQGVRDFLSKKRMTPLYDIFIKESVPEWMYEIFVL